MTKLNKTAILFSCISLLVWVVALTIIVITPMGVAWLLVNTVVFVIACAATVPALMVVCVCLEKFFNVLTKENK